MNLNKLRDIFTPRPEKISRTARWFFGLPLAFVFYVVLSVLVPGFPDSMNGNLVKKSVLYIIILACLYVTSRFFLDFKFHRFFCDGRKFSFKALFLSFFLMLNACLGSELLLMAIFPSRYIRTDFSAPFALSWILSFILVILASVTEELIFRSYICFFLTDSMPCKRKTQLKYCLVSALIFCLAHFSNPELEKNAAIPVLFYFMMGFALMAVTLQTHGIETALGIHIANNIVPAIFFSYPSSVLETKALFISRTSPGVETIIQSAVCLLAVITLCRALLCFDNQQSERTTQKENS